MEKIKNMMLTKVLAIVLTVLIMFSAISSLFVINANATSEDSKTTVYFMSNLSEPTIYMYNWCGEDNNFVTGEKVASEKKVESSDDSKIFNLWKFTVANKIDGAIFTTDDKWKDDDDDYNNSIKLTGNVMNKDNNTVLFFEQDGKSDLSEKKFTEYSAVKATLVTKEINALYDNAVELVDISALSPQGTFADYKVTYTLYNGDTELVSGDKGVLKYKFDKKDFKDSKVTLTLKAKDIAGNVEDCGNVTVNLIDEGSFKFEKDEDTKSYDENGIKLQKIDNFNNVDYSVVYDEDADKIDDFAKIEGDKLKVDSEKGNVGDFTIKATATAYGKDLSASYKLKVTKADKEDWKYDDGKTDDVKFGASYSIVPPIEGVTDFSCKVTMDSGNIDEYVNLAGNVLSFKKYTNQPIKVEVTFNGDKFYNRATATYTVRCVLDNFKGLDNINITSEGVVEGETYDYNKDVTISSNYYTFLDYDLNINKSLSEISEDWKDSVTLNKNIENPTFLVKGEDGVIYKYQSNIRIDKNSPNGKIELQSSPAVWDKLFIGKFDFNNFIQTLNSNSKEPLYVTANDDAEGAGFNSGLAKVQYYVVETDPEKQLKREDLDKIKNDWKDAEKKDDHYEVSAPVNKTSVIYVKIADNFNNVTYISTNGLVSETIAPTCDVNVTNNEELYKTFGYYNQDVNVNVTNIKDTGNLQSGVKSVSITAKDKDGNDIQIKDNTVTSGFENDLTFTIPIENLEKQEISYDVTVTDNCNNSLVVSKKATVCGINKFKIDLNDYEGKVDTVYNQDTAECTVTYITTGNVSENITEEFQNLLSDKYASISVKNPTTVDWKKAEYGCYIANVTLTSEDFSYEMKELKEATTDSILPKTLVFDTTSPKVTISYDNNDVKNEKYFNAERTATVTVDDVNFKGASDMVNITKDGEETDELKISWDGNIGTVKFVDEGEYEFAINKDNLMDLAGNKVKAEDIKYAEGTKAEDDFVISKTSPKVTISYDNNDVKNVKYFNTARIATVTVDAEHFKGNENMVTITKNGEETDEPKISWDGNIGTVTFENDGAYIFNINTDNLQDLSGNKVKSEDIKYDEDTEAEKNFVIDKTSPKVIISYDNNDVKNDKYFKAARTATVTVDDVNFKGTSDMVTITKDGEETAEPKISWDGNIGTVTFENDGAYIFNINTDNLQDLSGNKVKAEDIKYAEGTKAEGNFVIDKTSPKVIISYDNNDVKNDKYFKAARTATVTVDDKNFVGAEGMITVEATDPNGKVSYPTVTWVNKSKATFECKKDAHYKIKIKDTFVDLASNKAKIQTNDDSLFDFIIDKIAPKVTITYDNNNVKNSKYFNKARKGTITVSDYNFKYENNMITVEATDPNGKVSYQTVTWVNKSKATFACKKDAHYKVKFEDAFVDLAGNRAVDTTDKKQKAPHYFVIDQTAPTASIVVKDSAGNIVGKEKKSYSSKIKFNNYSNKTSKATLTFEDNITKNKNLIVKYYVSENPVSIKTLTGLKENKWKKYTKEISFSPDKKFVVYAKVTDAAGNTKYISSDGIILDKTKPNIDGIAPNIKLDTTSNTPKKSIHGYNVFSGDVVVDYKISDPIKNNTCSGIDMGELSYEIRKDNTVSQSGKLSSLSGKITVLASKNNSNNVTLTVTAKDKAGNVSKKVANLKIDITRPQITVEYDNNSALNDKMFKNNRTAKIIVKERNFDPNKVNVTVTADGSNYPVSLNWKDGDYAGTDSYEHTATVLFSNNKDYTFDVNCSDEVGNESSGVNYGDSVAPTSFTVDKIAPQVTVSYDNNNAQNDNYYNQERTATITINEHNFNENDVKWNVTSTGDNSPSLSSWSNSGDTHTATITYSDDAKYNFTIDYTDMAGNKCNTVPSDEFYVDKTAPKISISGVDYHSANRDNVVGFTLSANDENIDSTTFENDIELVQINGKNKNITSTDNIAVVDNSTLTYTVNNLDSDGVYAIKCNVKDKAGNSTNEISVTDEKGKSIKKKVVEFSVNRNGSTFILDKNTKKVVNKGYVQNVDNDVEITEINPNRIKDITLQLEKDNVKRELKENQDYTVKKDFSDTSWNTCRYTIKSSCFKNEGSYVLSLKTTDKAGNPSYNETDNPPYSNEDIAKVNFVVDKTCPSILVSNLQSNGRYNTDKQKVNIIADDNTSISKLQVFLNGKLFKEYSQKEIAKNNGKFTLEINSSDDLQSLKVVGVDLAGNSTDDKGNKKIEYKNFLVTTNFWIQYINNTVALVVTAIVVLLIAGAVVFIIVKKRKKKQK